MEPGARIVILKSPLRPSGVKLLIDHIVAEGEDLVEDSSGVGSLLLTLDREFAHESRVVDGEENSGGLVEGVYARFNGIAGNPLRNSFHFGQTIHDDFGRPYGQGSNVVSGVSGHAERGPFVIYARGEYQRAASSLGYSASAQQTIENYDRANEAWQLAPGAAMPPHLTTIPRLLAGFG